MAFQIRQLQAVDAVDYRELRLEALDKCPEAFSSSHAEDDGLPIARYEAALAVTMVLGGFRLNRLEGVIAVTRSNFVKLRHRAVITGIYVREGARGSGLSDQLIQAARKQAGDGIEYLQFRVPVNNDDALALCRRNGFEQIGMEPHAIRLDDGCYIDQAVMYCALSR